MNIIYIIVIFLIILISLIFLIRSKLITIMSFGLRLGFISFIILALSGLFAAPLYRLCADITLKQFRIHDGIQKVDEKISMKNLKEPAEDLWNDIKKVFENEENSTIEESETKDGYLEENLYPNLVTMLSTIYRVLTVVLSIIGLIAIVYLSYITSGITDLDRLKRRCDKLEEKLNIIENKFQI